MKNPKIDKFPARYKPNHWVDGDPLFRDHAGHWNFSSDKPVTHLNEYIDYAISKQIENAYYPVDCILADIIDSTIQCDAIIINMMNSYTKTA